MENVILTQLYSFLIYLVSGIIIGLFFDIFRILRKSFHTPDFITYIEDILFWLFTGVFLIFVLFKFSNGQIRIYNVVGLLVGVIIYIISISKFFIKINVTIITFIKNIIYKILKFILYPIKFIFRIIRKIFKPFTFFIINIKKVLSNFKKKMIKNVKIDNKTEKNSYGKKDFRKKCRKI